MQDLIQRLRQFQRVYNPPCNEYQMGYFKNVLQAQDMPDFAAPENPVFKDLMALYRDHNGVPISDEHIPFPRMMSFEELLAFQGAASHIIGHDKMLLWDAGDSNYYGICLHEPLIGRTFYLNHDGAQFTLEYRSVRRMYEAMVADAERHLSGERGSSQVWWHYGTGGTTDYPKHAPDPEHDDEDMAAAQDYIDRYQAEEDWEVREAHAEIAMSLLPFNTREPLDMFMDDPQTQARAILTFALRRDESVIPRINAVIRTQGRLFPGVRALAQIGTPAAIDMLAGIARDIEKIAPDSASSVLEQFRLLGYETRHDENKFSYRKNGSDEWVYFGQV
jgi:hypothetical protein